MLDPKSPQGLAISNLFVLTLLIAAAIFLLVAGLVVYIAFRYRARDGQGDPKPNFGRTKLEIAWTLGPLLLLAFLFVLTVKGMGDADPAVGQDAQPNLLVVAHQWWWEIGYPGTGITTANEIHLPAGQPMLASVESEDVIHDLWIPQIGRKIDMIPGKSNMVWLEADVPGVYEGACAEYCGVEHSKMLIRAIVQPQEEYNAWIVAQRKNAPRIPTDAGAVMGQKLFQQKTCISCHAINGTDANAKVGPNLTHFASRQTLASGIMLNNKFNLAKWIQDPQEIKPGSYMPDLQLTQDEVKQLVDYVETLK